MQIQWLRRSMLAAVLLSIGLWMVPLPAPAVEVGEKAPDFLMHSTVGESVRLSDYQGKKNVMLFFFLAAFTGTWTGEALAFQLDLPKYESLDTQVLGVSVDVLGALQAFAEKLGLTYPLLSDFSRDTVKKYGVMYDDPSSAYFRMAQRAYVVIDKQGIIRYTHTMQDARHMLDSEEIFSTVQRVVAEAK
jgi:peroxiredoxin